MDELMKTRPPLGGAERMEWNRKLDAALAEAAQRLIVGAGLALAGAHEDRDTRATERAERIMANALAARVLAGAENERHGAPSPA